MRTVSLSNRDKHNTITKMKNVVFLLSLFLVGHQAQTTGNELADLYVDVLLQYDVFPPINDDPSVWQGNTTSPIQVVLGTYLLSVDEISPASSEFTATARTVMYWKNNDCNQTSVHELACSARFGNGDGLRFVRATSTKTIRSSSSLQVPDAHRQVFIDMQMEDLQPDAEIIQSQTTFSQSFDMRNFPFEFHELKVSLVSFYTDNVVSLNSFGVDPAGLSPTVPKGWTLHGVSCSLGEVSPGGVRSAITTRPYHTYDCVIQVSKKNASWWMTSFLLFSGLMVMTFLGNFGVLAHAVAEQRDDKDAARRALYEGTRFMGTFTIGLLLTYVFQVEASPYGQPVEFWPSIPTSTMVYILGLVAILVQSLTGMLWAVIFPVPLVREGFRGTPFTCYEIDKLPVEGKAGEEDYPLLLKKYIPERGTESKRGGDDERPKGHGGKQPADEKSDASPTDEKSDEKPPTASEAPADESMKIAKGRKNNMKKYNVLSVEEAILVNKYVRQILFLKAGLMFSVIVCTMSFLLTAKSRWDDMVADATS